MSLLIPSTDCAFPEAGLMMEINNQETEISTWNLLRQILSYFLCILLCETWSLSCGSIM